MTDRSQRQAVRVHLDPRLVVAVAGAALGVVVLRNLVVEAHRVLGWAIAASVVAVLLRPLVTALARVVPTLVALVGVGLGIAALTGAVVYGVLGDIDTETDRLSTQGVAAAAELEARDDRLGELARDLRLQERASAFFGEVRAGVGTPEEGLRSAAGSVPTYFVSWILTIFLMLHGARIVAGALGLIEDPDRRDRWTSVIGRATHAGRGYVLVALAQGLGAAALAGAVTVLLDLPAPVLTALLFGTVAMVPYIGIVIGSLPLALLAGGLQSPETGIAVLAGAVALQVLEILVIRPRVDGATLHVGPAAPVVVGTLGYAVYGIGGAVYGVALAVFALAGLDAAAHPDDPDLVTPIEEPEPASAAPVPAPGQ